MEQMNMISSQVYQGEAGLSIDEISSHPSIKEGAQLPPGHYYCIKHHHNPFMFTFFQDGSVVEEGVNGVTTEAVMGMLIHRLKTQYAQGGVPDPAKLEAVRHLENAVRALGTAGLINTLMDETAIPMTDSVKALT